MASLRPRLLVAMTVVGLVAGCGSGTDEGPRSVAEAFESAWSRQDGNAVCRVLAPETRVEVARNGEAPCARAILEEEIPSASPVRSSRVWGRAAQVRTVNDSLFLAEFAQGWLVVAAACRPQPGMPYECRIKGG